MNLTEYCKHYGSIAQESEKLFIANFLYPLVGEKIDKGPQYPFLDRTGRSRRIDFAIQGSHGHPSLRGKGETYQAEGIIPNDQFDENLFRQ